MSLTEFLQEAPGDALDNPKVQKETKEEVGADRNCLNLRVCVARACPAGIWRAMLYCQAGQERPFRELGIAQLSESY